MCSKMGLPCTLSIGLGNSWVSSFIRVPLPAAKSTAFICGARNLFRSSIALRRLLRNKFRAPPEDFTGLSALSRRRSFLQTPARRWGNAAHIPRRLGFFRPEGAAGAARIIAGCFSMSPNGPRSVVSRLLLLSQFDGRGRLSKIIYEAALDREG